MCRLRISLDHVCGHSCWLEFVSFELGYRIPNKLCFVSSSSINLEVSPRPMYWVSLSRLVVAIFDQTVRMYHHDPSHRKSYPMSAFVGIPLCATFSHYQFLWFPWWLSKQSWSNMTTHHLGTFGGLKHIVFWWISHEDILELLQTRLQTDADCNWVHFSLVGWWSLCLPSMGK